jgi:uncharacterized NAD-dependent epimerase/dehydratase family protein
MYGGNVVAITLNTGKVDEQTARDYADKYSKQLNIPVILPLEDGVEALIPIFENLIKKSTATTL